MARPKKLKPDYCHDEASGRAFVRINGKEGPKGGPRRRRRGSAADGRTCDRVAVTVVHKPL